MKNKSWISYMITACMAAGLALTGCANATSEAETKESKTQTEEETYSPKEHVNENQVDKSETVYVSTDAKGKVTEIKVSDTLKNPGGLDEIEDLSNLTDIRNLNGNENFTQDGSKIVWENHGEDITYKGTATAELPMNVKVTYYLDGEETEPEEMAGKAGHVKIHFDYENNTDYVPFACISLVMIGEEQGYNVTSTGEVMNYNNSSIALGLAVPGISEALGLNESELFEDLEIKDTFEVEYDTEAFELDYTETIVTNGLFNKLEDEDLDDLSEDTDSMSDSTEASDKLEDGIDELLDGLKKYKDGVTDFKDGLKTYTDGVASAADGAASLAEGLEGLKAYEALLPAELASAVDQLADGAATLSDGMNQLTSAGDSLNDGAQALADGADALIDGVDALQEGVDKLTEEALSKMGNYGAELHDLVDKLKTLKGEDAEYTNYSGLAEGASGEVMFMIETAEIKAE